MKIVKKADGQKIMHLTSREFEVVRLLICVGNTYVRTDRDANEETKTTAEHIQQDILQNSDSEVGGG